MKTEFNITNNRNIESKIELYWK